MRPQEKQSQTDSQAHHPTKAEPNLDSVEYPARSYYRKNVA